MPNRRFFTFSKPLSVDDAIKLAGADIERSLEGEVRAVAAPDETDLSDKVVFVETTKAAKALSSRKIGLCLIAPAFEKELSVEGAVGVMNNPKAGFYAIADHLHEEIACSPETSGVSPDATIADNAKVHAGAIVHAGAEIAEGAVISAYAVIGPGVKIGECSMIECHAHVACAMIGQRCRIGSGARIGQPGFGFMQTEKGLVRTPQLGHVVIDDEVEIGSLSTVDRAALGKTSIGRGSKIDSQVHIGHNVEVGRYCVIAGHAGIAGSVKIGDGVLMGGHVGIGDHVVIGDGAQIAGKAGIMRDIPAGEKWGGYPAQPMRSWLRGVAATNKIVTAGERSRKK